MCLLLGRAKSIAVITCNIAGNERDDDSCVWGEVV